MGKISVIIPVYKVEPYLDQCVESVVNQTFRDLEILLIDDGSPDRCPEMCDAWEARYPRIGVIYKENGGLSDARNVGLDEAEGEYIAFVDSDDFVEREYIEYLYRALQETGADLAACAYDRKDEFPDRTEAERAMVRPVLQTPEEALTILSTHPGGYINATVWNKLYRRERIGAERFAVGFYGQDTLFSCHIYGSSRKIALIKNVLYHWRNTSGSAMHRFPIHPLHVMEMYSRAAEYLARNYPTIAGDCKVYMCSHFSWFCYRLRYGEPVEGGEEALCAMRVLREKVVFTREEWANCSLRDKIRVLCSRPGTVGAYIRLRHLLAVCFGWET